MNNFPRNRYHSDLMLSLFESSDIKECSGDYYKAFEMHGEEFEIYFPHTEGVIDEKYFQKARRLLGHIKELDNLVQDSCEEEFIKSKIDVRNFLLYLAIIEVGKDEVALRYYGKRVNTEWNAIFTEESNGSWVKVNF